MPQTAQIQGRPKDIVVLKQSGEVLCKLVTGLLLSSVGSYTHNECAQIVFFYWL